MPRRRKPSPDAIIITSVVALILVLLGLKAWLILAAIQLLSRSA